MADKEFLRHFITEPVYIIPDQNVEAKKRLESEKTTTSEQPAEANKNLVFKGVNKRKVLIMVNQPGEDFISAATETFLIKVLSAIQLSADDVCILNHQENQDLTKEAVLTFDADKYLFFGISTGEIFGNSFSLYEILKLSKNKDLLNCSSLETIMAEPSQKRLLWTALQKMFL